MFRPVLVVAGPCWVVGLLHLEGSNPHDSVSNDSNAVQAAQGLWHCTNYAGKCQVGSSALSSFQAFGKTSTFTRQHQAMTKMATGEIASWLRLRLTPDWEVLLMRQRHVERALASASWWCTEFVYLLWSLFMPCRRGRRSDAKRSMTNHCRTWSS